MADIQGIVKKYGNGNWNALRSVQDPLFEGWNPNDNWNAYRPADTGASSQPAQPQGIQQPAASSQPKDTFPPGYQFPSSFPDLPYKPNDQRSPNTYGTSDNGYPADWPGYGSPGNPFPFATGGKSYEDYLKEILKSGVGQDEASKTADIIYGRNGNEPTQNTGNTGNFDWNAVPGDLNSAIQLANQYAYGGRNKHDNAGYWADMWAKDPGYTWKRLIGMGAGAGDAASAGPYSGGDPNAEKPGQVNRAGQPPPGQPMMQAANTLTNPFDDPATKGFIDMLNQRIAQPQTPHDNPDLTALQGYLRQYSEKLQGPAYTPAQMDLMQTQSLDPLEHQRTQARDQVVQRLASRGIPPSSGIVEKALQDVDRSFNELRTKTQAGFASKAIDLDRINAQQAAGVGQLLANLDQTQFSNQEGRADQAVGYAQTIPNLARQRLQDAVSVMSGQQINPAQLIGQTMQAGQFQDAQSQAMMGSLFQLLPALLNVNWGRLFGGGQ